MQQQTTPAIIRNFKAENTLSVEWQNGDHSEYTWFWLRDHGEDAESLHPQTLQRQVDTFSIPDNLQAVAVSLSEDQQFQIQWSDGKETHISAPTLAQVSGLSGLSPCLLPKVRQLWSASDPLATPPTVEYQALLDSETAVKDWLNLIHSQGFAIVTGCQPDKQSTIRLVERIATAQKTLFGTYWQLSADMDEHADSAYETHFLAPHTDGIYYDNAGGLQLFNCMEFNGKGGESVLLDGFALAEILKKESPQHYQCLTDISVPGRYVDKSTYFYAERPVLRLDSTGDLQQISFNNYDRAPFLLSADKMDDFYSAYQAIQQLIMDQDHWLTIPLRPGQALVFDNWRCLHGRMGYTGKRVFYGCYIDHADYQNRLRVLNQAS